MAILCPSGRLTSFSTHWLVGRNEVKGAFYRKSSKISL